MSSVPLLNEGNLHLLVAYSLSSGEEMDEAVVNAFHAANIDVFDEPTELIDWIDADVFNLLDWSSNRQLYLSTDIWGHLVVITPEEVRIYSQSSPI